MINAVSIGNLAISFQSNTTTVREVAEQMNIEPVLVLNGIPYYALVDCHTMRPRFLPTENREPNAKPPAPAK